MRVVMFYHSLVSDWNHGNAHFLRGIASELQARGHTVRVYEPREGWSLRNLLAEHGAKPVRQFRDAYPDLESEPYALEEIDLDAALTGADLVLVHEWNEAELVQRIGEARRRMGTFKLLFHDTHHRMVTQPEAMDAYDLRHYDGVLAYGRVLTELYRKRGLARRAWTWHEAADVNVFRPGSAPERQGDLVWIGNWGDDERSAELREFLVGPVAAMGLKARLYGVRYPQEAQVALAEAGIEYDGWVPNHRVPEVFSRYLMTVHIPRRPYVTVLPGIPTIRVFEALSCGIPLISSPWRDAEGLFREGKDYVRANDGREMAEWMNRLRESEGLREELAVSGLETIRARHTCAHRVRELMEICGELDRG